MAHPLLIASVLLALTAGARGQIEIKTEAKTVAGPGPALGAATGFVPGEAVWSGETALPAGARRRLGSGTALLGEYQGGAALSPDGKYLALGAAADSVTLVELSTGKPVATVRSPGSSSFSIVQPAFSADGRVLAFSDPGGITVAAVPSGKLLRHLPQQGQNVYGVRSVALSADGRFAAAGDPNAGNGPARASVWEVATGRTFGPFVAIQNAGIWATLSPDGKVLATGGRHFARGAVPEPDPPQTIQLWDVASGKELHRVKLDSPFAQPNVFNSTYINVAAFSPDGTTLAAASGQSTFHLIDVGTGKERRRFAGRRSQTQLLVYSGNGGLLVAGGIDGTVQAWEPDRGRPKVLTAGPKARVLSVAFPPRGGPLVLGALGQALTWWDAASGKVGYAPKGHTLPVVSLAFSPDGRSLTSAAGDGHLLRWDAGSGAALGAFALRDDDSVRLAANVRYNGLTVSADARFAAGTNPFGGNTVGLWDLAASRFVCDIDANRVSNTAGLAFTPRGDKLAITSPWGVSLWDTARGEEVARVGFGTKELHGTGMHLRPAISPDGALVAVPVHGYAPNSGQQTTQLVVADLARGRELYTVPFAPNTYSNLQLAFSPDGRYLAVAGHGTPITLLRAATGHELLRLPYHPPTAPQYWSALAFAPDGRTLAVAPVGQHVFDATGRPRSPVPPTIDVWEITGGGVRQSFQGHRAQIHCLAFSPDGRTLASGSQDTTVLLWDMRHTGPAPEAADDPWAALGGSDAAAAFRTMQRLRGAPAAALALLKDHLRPAVGDPAERDRVAQAVADLDSDNFSRRDAAYRELTRLGPRAEPALRRALESGMSLEGRRRVAELLDRLQRTALTARDAQIVRAVELLEGLDGPEAQALLGALAQGDEAALLTQEARQALARKQVRAAP